MNKNRHLQEATPFRRDCIFAECLAEMFSEFDLFRAAESFRRVHEWEREGLWKTLRTARLMAEKVAGRSMEGYRAYIRGQLSGLLGYRRMQEKIANGELAGPTLAMLCGGFASQRFLFHQKQVRSRIARRPQPVRAVDPARMDAKIATMAKAWGIPPWKFLQATIGSGFYDRAWVRASPMVQQLLRRRILRLPKELQ